MSSTGAVDIIDRDGWRKTFPLPEKALIYIGSDPGNDIFLDRSRGGGVAPRHLQLIALQEAEGYRLVNLADSPVVLQDREERELGPASYAQITGEQMVGLGDFVLVFQMKPVLAVKEQQSEVIGLDFSLAGKQLAFDRPLGGVITLSNLGDRSEVQFNIEIEGFDPEFFEFTESAIEPGPILFPQAERRFPLRLHHPQLPWPPAGEHRIVVRATAPGAYPGQVSIVSKAIEIRPFYRHTLRLTGEESSDGSN